MRPLTPDDPTHLGGYRLTAHLGSGALGPVFAGVREDGRAAAVRAVRAEDAADPAFHSLLDREAELIGRIRNRFVVPLLGHDLSAAQPWTATAYVCGPSLLDLVDRTGPLPATALAHIARGLAEALAHVHAAGTIHLGLTPAHVLVDAAGPRLVDVGLRRAADGARITSPGDSVYWSPEHLPGDRAAPADDLYSLGAVLAFAATGRAPSGNGPAAMVDALREGWAGTASPLPDAVAACLDVRPEHRPSAADLLRALGGPLPADPVPWLPSGARALVTRFGEDSATALRTARAARPGPRGRGPDADRAAGPCEAAPFLARPQARSETRHEGPAASGPRPRPGDGREAAAGTATGSPAATRASRAARRRRVAVRIAAAAGAAVLFVTTGLAVSATLSSDDVLPTDLQAPDCSSPRGIDPGLIPEEEPRTRFSPDLPFRLSFSPNGSVLAVSQVGGVDLWDWDSSSPLAAIPADGLVPPGPVAFSPNGCVLVHGGPDGAAVTDLPTGEGTHVGGGTVHSVAFSPDGATLAVGVEGDPNNRLLHLLDPDTGETVSELAGSARLGALRYSADGGTLVGSEDNAGFAVWRLDRPDDVSLIGDGSGSEAFAVLPDGSGILLVQSDRVVLVDPETGDVEREFAPPPGDGVLVDVAYSRTTGRVLAARLNAAMGAESVVAWDLRTAERVRLPEEPPAVFPMTLSPSGNHLAGLRAGTHDIAVYDMDFSLVGVLSQ
ncbi:WD40 repeat domain-containing serine/threonine protein kinase [Nocardiopsis sp. YSL2]|uniref:WD40 repeat domain-containing serine/threonine protein kinase n=1 Tax=Nocardiopsis sp. YSL2 TaxID=2939492 RepID=UPI0026F423CC|nr:WD40 repeat domain-containing serine/threonine protein kinase [Nocardiopsis sp. YSL2]